MFINRGMDKEDVVSQSVQSLGCVTLCDRMDCSMPGFPVHRQLLELAQTCVHRVSDVLKSYLKAKYGYLGICTG